MKKDDNTTNYSARLVCEECGYVFGLKEVAYIEHGGMIDPYFSKDKEILQYNEIYPKVCPKCKREAQHISYGIKLGVYCSKDKEEADVAIKKQAEEELKKLTNFEKYFSLTPAAATGILAYCNNDVNVTKYVDCEVIKDYCSACENCPKKDSVSPKYFEKHGLYPCAVFMAFKNANDFAEYMLRRIDICSNADDKISLAYVSTAVAFYNGYVRLHKSAENYSIAMPTVNDGRCGWTKEELQTYGVSIDFEENPIAGRAYCVYLPVPKYFGGKKEDSK